MALLVIGSGASTARRWHYLRRNSTDIKIDLWNRHLTNNEIWVFSHEIKEQSCKFLFIIYIRCFYIMSSTLLVHTNVLREPFLP
jgi:hypothetical protein